MKKISTILKNLENLWVSGVKQSTEDQISSSEDILSMRKITKKIQVNLSVKIEGFDIDTNFQFNYADHLHKKLFNN